MVRKTFVVSVALAVLMVVAVCGPARAVSIWDGGGTDDNWTTAANWVGDVAPGTGSGVEVQFAGPNRLTPNVDTNNPWAVGKIVFNSGAGAFDIGGFEIALQAASGNEILRNNSSSTQTVTSDLRADTAKWFNAVSGHIVIDGDLDLQQSVTVRGNKNVTVNGLISGASGRAISRTDGGTLKLTNAGNTFSGTPGISHGVLEIANIANSGVPSAIGTGTALRLGQGTWGPSDTGTLRYTGPTAATNRTIQMTSNDRYGNGPPGSGRSGRPTIDVTNAATTLTFNGNFVYYGSSTLGQWRLRGAGNGVINGNITTAGARLEKSGTGMWTINGSSNHSDITEVLAGVLTITNASALGTTAGGTTVTSSAAQLRLIGGITVNEPLTISGNGTGSAPGTRGALRSHSGSNVWTGSITIPAGAGHTYINAAGGPLTLSGGVSSAGANAHLRLDQGATTVNGSPITLGTNNLYVNSSSFLSVVGNTFGTLVVDWNGNFHMGVANALPANVTVKLGAVSTNPSADNGTLDLYGYDQTIGRLMDGSTVYVDEVVTNSQATAATLTINQSVASTYQGTITGNLALTKSGGGKLTLGGTNTFSGATLISAGTLALSGSGSIHGSPTINVAGGATFDVLGVTGGNYSLANGQTLTGGGSVVGALTVADGSTISPGDCPGKISMGDTTWAGGGDYLWEINDFDGGVVGVGNDPGWDLLNIAGTLTISATQGDQFTIDLTTLKLNNDPGPAAGLLELEDSFEIARASGGIIGFDPDKFVLDTSDFDFDIGTNYFTITQEDKSLYLNYVPEPATLTLLGLGAVGLLARRRRRK